MQEAVTLAVFLPFALPYVRQPLKPDCLRASLCIMAAVYRIFRNGPCSRRAPGVSSRALPWFVDLEIDQQRALQRTVVVVAHHEVAVVAMVREPLEIVD